MSAPDDAPKSAPKIPLAQRAVTYVAQIVLMSSFPFPRTDSRHALRDGCPERREAVEDRSADLKLGCLAVEVA